MGAGTAIPLGEPALTGTCYNAESMQAGVRGEGMRGRREGRQEGDDRGSE